MKTQLWIDIINSNNLAPRDGIYLFMCRGDMHLLTELHWLNKGERLYKYYEGEYQHDNVWARVWPYGYSRADDNASSHEAKDYLYDSLLINN